MTIMFTLLAVQLLLFSFVTPKSIVDEFFEAVDRFGPEIDHDVEADMHVTSSYGTYGLGRRHFGTIESSGDKESEKERFLQFKEIKDEIDHINADNSVPFNASVNKFALLTPQERELYHGLNLSLHAQYEDGTYFDAPNVEAQVPNSVNWVERGAQPPIKNQGICGSCWAFAGVSVIEAGYYQVTGDQISFSDQEILDCGYESKKKKNGCDGGWLNVPAKYVKNNRRLSAEKDNRYKGNDGTCNYHATNGVPNSFTKAVVIGAKRLKGDKKLLEAASRGVVAVAIHATKKFHIYGSGVYEDTACNYPVNHAVTVVGYGQQSGKNFWFVRNQWGRSWGEQGYIRMSRHVPNMCMISKYVYQTEIRCSDENACSPPQFKNEESYEEAEPVCENKIKYRRCRRLRRYCPSDNPWLDYMVDNCPAFCGTCNGAGCKDKLKRRKCRRMKRYCPISEYWSTYMKDNCDEACGTCNSVNGWSEDHIAEDGEEGWEDAEMELLEDEFEEEFGEDYDEDVGGWSNEEVL